MAPRISLLFAMLSGGAWAQPNPPILLSQAEIVQLEALIDRNPADLAAQKSLGRNYAYYSLGTTALDRFGGPSAFDIEKARSPFARHAAEELSGAAQHATILGEGGMTLWNGIAHLQGYLLINRLGDQLDLKPMYKIAINAVDLAIEKEPKVSDWRADRIRMTDLQSKFALVMPVNLKAAYAIMKGDCAMLTGLARNGVLPTVAKTAIRAGEFGDARTYATELLKNNDADSNYAGNLVLGQVAVHEGDLAKAKEYLLASGNSKGSPPLNSFGPNMSLAKDLLDAGERDAVIEFLNECRSFWKSPFSHVDEWIAQVKSGKTPNFGGNLNY